MTIKCPKCSATISATPDELGMVTCEQCGARLRSKQQVKVTVQSAGSSLPRIDPAVAAPADVDSVVARIDSAPSPDMTIRPGALTAPAAKATPLAPSAATLEEVLAEVRALADTQAEILALLRAWQAGPGGTGLSIPDTDDHMPLAPAPAPPKARVRAQRSVLVIDDDAAARHEVVQVLQAQAGVRTATDGNSALAAIALEKPDVIVLELDLGGSMPGRDLVNMIKATMEWVDIPLVLHTRHPMGDLSEERQIHGADDIVPKASGSAQTLAARVAALLKRG